MAEVRGAHPQKLKLSMPSECVAAVSLGRASWAADKPPPLITLFLPPASSIGTTHELDEGDAVARTEAFPSNKQL